MNTPQAQPALPASPGSATQPMTDRQLLNQIIMTLRVNMNQGRMTTENDEQFWLFIDAWDNGRSAWDIMPPNTTRSATPGGGQ